MFNYTIINNPADLKAAALAFVTAEGFTLDAQDLDAFCGEVSFFFEEKGLEGTALETRLRMELHCNY